MLVSPSRKDFAGFVSWLDLADDFFGGKFHSRFSKCVYVSVGSVGILISFISNQVLSNFVDQALFIIIFFFGQIHNFQMSESKNLKFIKKLKNFKIPKFLNLWI